jgi:hypothetical protein
MTSDLISHQNAYPDRTAWLNAAERKFLIVMRWWVLGYRTDNDPVPRIYQSLKKSGAADAAFSLNRFLAVVAESAERPIEIRHPRCHQLSGDEKLLLFAVSSAQTGQRKLVRSAMREIWIAGGGIEQSLEPLEELSGLFADAGFRFIRRPSPVALDTSGGSILVPWTRTIQ